MIKKFEQLNDQGKYKEAFAFLVKESKKGNGEASYQIARYYLMGIKEAGIKMDEKKAFRYMLHAAMKGIKIAVCELAIMYSEGHGTKKNKQEAFNWYVKAAEQGELYAIYEVIEHLSTNRTKLIRQIVSVMRTMREDHLNLIRKLLPPKASKELRQVSKSSHRLHD